jgi:hypothetical protein
VQLGVVWARVWLWTGWLAAADPSGLAVATPACGQPLIARPGVSGGPLGVRSNARKETTARFDIAGDEFHGARVAGQQGAPTWVSSGCWARRTLGRPVGVARGHCRRGRGGGAATALGT